MSSTLKFPNSDQESVVRETVVLLIGPRSATSSNEIASSFHGAPRTLVVSDVQHPASTSVQTVTKAEATEAFKGGWAEAVVVDDALRGYDLTEGLSPLLSWLSRLSMRTRTLVVARLEASSILAKSGLLLAVERCLGRGAASVERLGDGWNQTLVVSIDAAACAARIASSRPLHIVL